MATNENLPPNGITQLAKELKNLDETPPEGIKVVVNEDDLSTIFADIEGPSGTPYENGVFRMKLSLSKDFPNSPPKGYFLTKIFHPNIANNGEICVNTLKKDWNPSLGLRHVLLVVRCLLIEPFPEMNKLAKMLIENYEEYARLARLYTGIHAKPKTKSKTGAISESTAMNIDSTKNSTVNTGDATVTCLKAPMPPLATPLGDQTQCKGGTSVVVPVDQSAIGTQGVLIVTGPVLPKMATNKVLADKKIDARKKSLKRL
ncbi:E2 ubiquitin-conjugating enzyme [Ranunculus cassubicifolius]